MTDGAGHRVGFGKLLLPHQHFQSTLTTGRRPQFEHTALLSVLVVNGPGIQTCDQAAVVAADNRLASWWRWVFSISQM
ncbi:hypothetical protein DBIPINDM_008486 (plasmid) [Mesorhizobium sp. AR02]|uniref:hypothetical protein n=1 Tax=Mesorhizobium sp. AR02 TaxID=2865837 RepID=UPI00215E23DD|nr:hypothetical protein [Mesorhizobium sp. AR02]UVK57315.1 hypothetical protein DBIPINDM_008486 [Mesorhizobium sp. AR02]